MTITATTATQPAPLTLSEEARESVLTVRISAEQLGEHTATATATATVRAFLHGPGLGAPQTIAVPTALGHAPERIVLEGNAAGRSYERVWTKVTERAGEASYTFLFDTSSTGYVSVA